MNDLKPCPFCGGKLNFYRENYVNRFGKRIIEQYWMHDDTDCVLNDINQPFVLGAGDANPESMLKNGTGGRKEHDEAFL